MADVASTPVSGLRTGRLALAFQELLTTVLKVQSVDNPEFRNDILKQLERAAELAQAAGYSGEDIGLAQFAVVAFLDEAVLNSRNPRLTGWEPVQSQLFGTTDAGKVFFQKLEAIRARGNSPEVADLLEVYNFCLYLGFRGQFRIIGESGLPPLIASITRKISHIRKDVPHPKPLWAVPEDKTIVVSQDPWFRRLLFGFLASCLLALVLWVSFSNSLNSRIHQLADSAGLSYR